MDIQNAYTDAVEAMRALGNSLRPAVAIQFEAPPGGARRVEGEAARQGVSDTTVDLILDPRHVEVSQAIYAARTALAKMASDMRAHVHALDAAVDAWDGSAKTQKSAA